MHIHVPAAGTDASGTRAVPSPVMLDVEHVAELFDVSTRHIRRLVDAAGWQAVRQHPELGPLWAACLEDSRRHVDAVFRDQ
jgi:hypothetical protein